MADETKTDWKQTLKDASASALSVVSKKWVAYLLTLLFTTLVTALLTWLGVKAPPLPRPEPPDEPFIVIEGSEEDASPPTPLLIGAAPAAPIHRTVHTGWRRDPEAVRAVKAALPFKAFADTPAGQDDAPLPDHAYLWQAYRKLKGHNPPGKDQGQVGSCVSFGTNSAIERTMAVDIAVRGRPNEFKFIAEEVTYAGSRVEVGRNKISGDGSVNAWAAQFVQRYGVVSREKHGRHDLTGYDERRCREWGFRGVPDDLEPLARDHPVEDFTQVRAWEEAKKALASGHGIAIASNQGFGQRRDSRGVCKPLGNWNHSMCLDGYHTDEQGREYGHIDNSWGDDFFAGPVGWGDPGPSGFWAEARVVDRMLRQGDSWAFSAVKGFPTRRIKLDWFVERRPEQRRALEAPFALAP